MKTYKLPDFILYGGPASGKSTQAEILTKRLRARHLNMGNLLRRVVKAGGRNSQVVKKYIRAGKLAPQRITAKLVQDFIAATPLHKIIVFDGYPRSLFQARVLDTAEQKYGRHAVFIFIDLPVAAARDRIQKRAKLEGRVDDTSSQAISQRIGIFRKQSRNILSRYRRRSTLIKINGDQTVTAVSKDILTAVRGL